MENFLHLLKVVALIFTMVFVFFMSIIAIKGLSNTNANEGNCTHDLHK